MTENVSVVPNSRAIKFVVWLIIVSVIMMFAGLTSGYIVRRAAGNWTEFQLPSMFWISTLTILSSSLTIHWAYLCSKKEDRKTQQLTLWVSLVLGVSFLACQWFAWVALVQQGIYLTGNPSGSFLYIISGLHGLHIVAGLFLIIAALIGSYGKLVTERNIFRMEIVSIFWHFVDILWIYLFVFLLLNH